MTTIYQDGLVPGNLQVSLGGAITAGGGAGAVASITGVGFTAALVGTTYVVTLTDPYYQLWSATANASGTGVNDYVAVEASNFANTNTPTVTFQVYDDTGGAAILADDAKVYFHLTLVRSLAQ